MNFLHMVAMILLFACGNISAMVYRDEPRVIVPVVVALIAGWMSGMSVGMRMGGKR